MGTALAEAANPRGHQVLVVSGPVQIDYPHEAEVFSVDTTAEMLAAVLKHFPDCHGLIGAAAPCDYMPHRVSSEKIAKSGEPLRLELIETPDIALLQTSDLDNGLSVLHSKPRINVSEQ